MKRIAIIGPTASGKSGLALELAQRHDAFILSIDSLAIYKEFDIVSAKPTPFERQNVPHFGIDEIEPTQNFNVEKFLRLYQKAKTAALQAQKHLIIVGGTGFYLKALLDGISPIPSIPDPIKKLVEQELLDLSGAYEKLRLIDPEFAQKITPKDRYRIQKGLEIFYTTDLTPTAYFLTYPPQRIDRLPIYEIAIDRHSLRNKIELRTKKMLKLGLIDEIASLEKRYGRAIQPMKAIGVVETLQFLDGALKTKDELAENISIHTAQLAKRQQTFNKTQFSDKTVLPLERLRKELDRELAD